MPSQVVLGSPHGIPLDLLHKALTTLFTVEIGNESNGIPNNYWVITPKGDTNGTPRP